ncbi:serine hydrolase domain-containing protein [uncultured Vagococcus sp.]|uniref:serine hydrolase domain-containing protein n=1 Tax=uncultured Vagococcus sp. TaxID=189676 RepID=UPI0028D5364C|nr:serine hydrolase domain-containing protein [uncultured Vagococcus sp.]
MENKRKQQMKLQRKRQRRYIRFFFFFGLLLGSVAVFSFYHFYYEPQLAKTTEKKLTKYEQQIAILTEQNTDLQKKIDLNTQQLQEEEKKKPRMVFGQTNKGDQFPDLTKQIERKISDTGFIGSVLVIKNNQIVLEKGYGYADKSEERLNDPTTEFMIASVQKAYTAVLIMTLIENGLLTMDTPLSNFYPNIPNSNQITIKSLLNMTSGLQIKGFNSQSGSEEDTINYALNNATYSPLTKWNYSPVNYTLLAGIIRQLSGQSYQDYFTSQIITKLNLQQTGFYQNFYANPKHAVSSDSKSDPYLNPIKTADSTFASETGTGNAYSSTGDMFTFIQALLDGKLITKNSLTELWTRPKLAFDYTYAAGFYHNEQSINGHGVLVGFEPTLAFSPDGSTGIITFSNYIYPKSANANLTKEIFKLLA